jgi:hypothetical protein
MEDLAGLSEIEQGPDAGFTVLVFIFKLPAEFIRDGMAVIFVVNADNLNHCGNDPVDFTPVGFTVLIFKFLIQNGEVDNVFQVVASFSGKDYLVF